MRGKLALLEQGIFLKEFSTGMWLRMTVSDLHQSGLLYHPAVDSQARIQLAGNKSLISARKFEHHCKA